MLRRNPVRADWGILNNTRMHCAMQHAADTALLGGGTGGNGDRTTSRARAPRPAQFGSRAAAAHPALQTPCKQRQCTSQHVTV